jgi:thiamine monophosphate synthase
MLDVLEELDECAYYWSQYDVPVGIHDRIKLAIAKAKGEQP